MKQIIKITLSLLFIAASFSSCVDDKDFDTPQISENNDATVTTTSLTAAKNSLIQNFQTGDPSTLIYTFPDLEFESDGITPTNLLLVSAYVVSDDTTGNFYKKLIVQNSPENPTAGLEISIDQGNLHSLYNVGRKVYIKLNGLTIGYFDGSQGGAPGYINQSEPGNATPGVYKLGVLGDDFAVERISDLDFGKYITRSSITEIIVPKIIATSDISDDTMNTYVKFENMQFELAEIMANNGEGKTYAGETGDAYDASRFLLNCDTDYVLGLMTSTFSNYKTLLIPRDKGTVKGVLMKNFRESDPVIVLNSPNDVDFSDTDRCDPILLDCGLAGAEGTTDLLVENFDSGIPSTWTNYIQEGSRNWGDFSGSSAYAGKSVRVGSYNSGDASSIAWLISPVMDMDAQIGETLEFKTSNSFADGSKLELMFSTDWDGTEAGITTATWGLLTAATIVDDGEYYQNWVNSGVVDLSCAEGTTFYIAFKYTGSGNSSFDGTYELDDITIRY